MPLPTTLADLSLTAGSNYPSGSDSPSVLDDVQRQHATFIAQIRDGVQVTNAAAKTTPVDADYLPINDSAVSGLIKKITWANIKTSLASTFQAAGSYAESGANADITSLSALTNGIVGTSGNQTISGSKTFTGSVDLQGNFINNTSAVSDISLTVGSAAYVDVSSSTSVILHIATGDNQLYEITCSMLGASAASSGQTILSPNNTTYTNFFKYDVITESSSSQSQLAAYSNAPVLGYSGDPRCIKATVSTKTTSKWTISESIGQVPGPQTYSSRTHSLWQSAASSSGAGDTTTAWSSLGTITFPVSTSGRVYVKRIA
jgi:hypothetical protein